MSADPAVLERYLAPNLVEKVLGSGALSLEETLKTVGYLNDLLTAVSMYVPEHLSREATQLETSGEAFRSQSVEGTFLFADITGFTPLTEAMAAKGKAGAEELTKVINALFRQLLDFVAAYEGIVLKFGGDAILAYFPRSESPNHAVRALHAAHRMQRAVTRFRKLPPGVKGVRLEISIGLATGQVFAGPVGDRGDRAEYVVAGETLRRMARAEAAADSGQVFVDAASADLARSEFRFGERRGEFVQAVPPPAGDDSRDELDDGNRPENHLSMSGSMDVKVTKLVEGIDALRAFLPKPIFERVKASPGRVELEAEHRQVSTMFINFRGLDALVAAAGDDLSRVERPLGAFFRAVNEIVEQHHGIISRIGPATEGDNLLILFGAPVSVGNDARNAALAAIEIRDRTADLFRKGEIPFTVRIGVNTGFSFCADVGELRKEYTVMGDPVNLAARLMSIADEGTIRVGESTHERLGRGLDATAMAPVKVKGKSAPVQTYLLTGQAKFSAMRMTTTTLHRRKGMLGRQAELRQANAACQAAMSGNGQAIVVHGEMGIGKTLFLGAAQKLAGRLGLKCLSIGGSELEGSQPNRPWVLLLLRLLDVEESDDPEVVVGRLREALASRFPDLAVWDALIASYLDVQVAGPEEIYANLTARGRSDQFVRIVTTILEATSRESPLAIFLDHVERLDRASLMLLHHVIEKIATYGIFLCLATRDVKFFGMFFQLEHVRSLELGGLDLPATRRLIEEQIEVTGLPEDLAEGIHERTRGNPLLVSEMVAGLVHEGVLVVDPARNGATLTRALEDAGVADQVHTYFISKLDRVGYNCRKVLNLSTVLPDPILQSDLERLLPRIEMIDLDVAAALREAVREGILVEVGAESFSFQHPILKDVIYDSIAFDTRRIQHRELGKILEEDVFPNLERAADLLAHHFERSDDHHRAIKYLALAGDRAKDKYAPAQAAEYYRKAVERIRAHGLEKDKLIPVLDRYSRVLELEGRIADSVRVLEDCRRQSLLAAATASSKIGRLHTRLGDVAAAERHLGEAQKAFEELGDDYGLGHCLHNVGNLALAKGSASEAIQILTRGFDCLKKVGDKEGIARCLHTLSLAYKATGDYLRAADYLKSSLGINETLHDLLGMGVCHKSLGELFIDLEKFDAAAENLRTARQHLEEVGDKVSLSATHGFLGQLAVWRGDLEEALGSFARAARVREEMGDRPAAARSHLDRGRVLLVQGDLAGAAEELRSVEDVEDPAVRSVAALLAGDLCRDQGQLEEARRSHKEALVLAPKEAASDGECLAYLGLGRDLLWASRLNQAMGAIHLAFQKARQLQRRRLIILAGKGLGDVYVRIGRADRGIEFYLAAREQARQVGYVDLLPEILSALSEAMVLRREDLSGALEAGQEAWSLAKQLGSPVARIEALLAVLSTILVAGRIKKADQHLDRLVRESEDFGSPFLLARSHLVAARVAQATGDEPRAVSEAVASSELSGTLGCLWLLVPALRLLVDLVPGKESYRRQWQDAAAMMNDAIAEVAE